MLSKKIFSFFDLLSNICQKFNAITLLFDSKAQQFYVSTSPKLIQKIRIHYSMTTSWIIASFTLLFKYKEQQERTQLFLTFLYWLAGCIAIYIYTITRWFPNDMCRKVKWVDYISETFSQ